MPDQLLKIDRLLFHFVNQTIANPFFDWLLPILRNPIVWAPLYIFIFCLCIYKYKKVGVYIIVALALTFAAADQGSAHLVKGMVKRVRPCNDPAMANNIILRIPCGSGYSFPSAHASNHFAIAIFLCLIFGRRWKWVWPAAISWAAAISIAQVYVGVHYPIDVFCGAIYGCFIGWLFAWIFYKLQPGFAA